MRRKRHSAEEIINTLREAKVLIEGWRRHYNTIRPHSSLGYRPQSPETIAPAEACSAAQPSAGTGTRLPTNIELGTKPGGRSPSFDFSHLQEPEYGRF